MHVYIYTYIYRSNSRKEGGRRAGGGWTADGGRMADGGRTADGRRTAGGRTADGGRTDGGRTGLHPPHFLFVRRQLANSDQMYL